MDSIDRYFRLESVDPVANDKALEALKRIVEAWESLPEGRYTAKEISIWLLSCMKPTIDKAREIIIYTGKNNGQR